MHSVLLLTGSHPFPPEGGRDGLVDNDGKTQYVGRTRNPVVRERQHRADPTKAELQFMPIRSGLTAHEARGLEQISMVQHHTINTANRMNNQRNGISPRNKMLGVYMEAGRGAALYLENQFSNAALYWTGR